MQTSARARENSQNESVCNFPTRGNRGVSSQEREFPQTLPSAVNSYPTNLFSKIKRATLTFSIKKQVASYENIIQYNIIIEYICTGNLFQQN